MTGTSSRSSPVGTLTLKLPSNQKLPMRGSPNPTTVSALTSLRFLQSAALEARCRGTGQRGWRSRSALTFGLLPTNPPRF